MSARQLVSRPARIRLARIRSLRVASFLSGVMASRRNQLTFSSPESGGTLTVYKLIQPKIAASLLSQAEIEDLNLTCSRKQQIGRLDISVNQTSLVCIV